MTKKRSTKSALLLSVLSLLMCMSMLVGSTFAWFTDNVTSANNIIKSGTLDVAMEWTDGKNDPADTTVTWTDASTGAMFNYDKWEPGYADVKHIRISNKGTLALKYQLNIAANGEVSKLAEVIDVYYADPAVKVENRAALAGAQKLNTLDKVLANLSTTASGELLAGESVTITLGLKMQETAGNTYQNLSIGSDFSVELLATQLTYEKDSFDDQYDNDSTYPGDFVGGKGTAEDPYLISEGSQLLNISDYYNEYTYFKVADGVKTLDLTGVGKINLNGSFDGNGVEITGLTTALFEFVGKVGDPQDIKISNFTATVNTTDGRALVKNINNSGTTTFENVTLHGYIEGEYNMGSFYNYGTANNTAGSDGANYTVSFVNATSDVTLVCTTGNAIGGMLGHGFEGANYKLSINMDEKSGYSGQMYVTGTAKGYGVMAMCSHATYILNGTEVKTTATVYPTTKLTVAAPAAGADGYYVAPAAGVDHYVVSLNSQLTAYDENGVKIANKAGMTWVLGEETITEGFDGKIFDLVDSAAIVNGEEHTRGYELKDGKLTIYSGSDLNYASGWVTLYVNQYDANGTILATGKIRIHTFAEPNA